MWRYQLGFLLHPDINLRAQDLQIADVACGTGQVTLTSTSPPIWTDLCSSWLIETARALPNAHLDGYDILSDQFPHRSRLPGNVELSTMDILASLGPLPEHLVGLYDVQPFRSCGMAY